LLVATNSCATCLTCHAFEIANTAIIGICLQVATNPLAIALPGGADAAFTIQAYLSICSAVRTIRIAGTSCWATALIHRTIAVIIFAIAADLALAVTLWFRAYPFLIAFDLFAHSVWFI
jgi:hypothetical protein